MNYDAISSRLCTEMKPSIIRSLLKLVQSPDIISFAGGTPDAALFPLEDFADLARKVILEQGSLSLQYGLTQGWVPLREQIAQYLGGKGLRLDADQHGECENEDAHGITAGWSASTSSRHLM